MGETGKRIVLVGHCGPDSYALRSAIGSAVPGAKIEFANDEEAAIKAAAEGALLLINRELDGGFATDGLGLVAKLAGATKVMLISNYEDAQAASEKAGALPGFGKRGMYSEEAKERLRGAVGG